MLDRRKHPTDEPDALPAAFDSGSPVWVETGEGWRLSGVTITATGRRGPNFGDRSTYQLVTPVQEWLQKSLETPTEPSAIDP